MQYITWDTLHSRTPADFGIFVSSLLFGFVSFVGYCPFHLFGQAHKAGFFSCTARPGFVSAFRNSTYPLLLLLNAMPITLVGTSRELKNRRVLPPIDLLSLLDRPAGGVVVADDAALPAKPNRSSSTRDNSLPSRKVCSTCHSSMRSYSIGSGNNPEVRAFALVANHLSIVNT